MGTWTDIENNENGGSVRKKLNDAMQYVFGWIASPPPGEDQSQWEAQGPNDIKPKNFKGVAGPNLNVADDFIVPPAGDITASRAVTITGQTKMVNLATGGDPRPVLADSEGNIITDLETGTNTITINVYSNVTMEAVTGFITFFGLPGYTEPIQFSGFPSVFIENLPNVTGPVTYRVDDVQGSYYPKFGTIGPINGDHAFGVMMQSIVGAEPGDVVEARRGEVVSEGVSAQITAKNPIVVSEHSENFMLTLDDPETVKTAEFVARKSDDGEALTLFSNGLIRLNSDEGNVLTTTTEGAWVRLKSIQTDPTTYKWVVIMDSGNWEIDNI